MSEEKMMELIKRIEADMRELADITGAFHISAFVIDGRFNIEDYSNLTNPKFNYYNQGVENE